MTLLSQRDVNDEGVKSYAILHVEQAHVPMDYFIKVKRVSESMLHTTLRSIDLGECDIFLDQLFTSN